MILAEPGTSSFVGPTRPPVEARGRADQLRVALQLSAAGKLGILQLLDGSEVAVDQAGVGQWPQVLGRLELGRVRRQEEQMDMLGYTQAEARVPAGPVEHEDDLLAGTGPDRVGERGELDFKECNADARCQVEDRATRSRMDEANEIAPGEAVAYQGDRALSAGRPHPPQERFEPNAMFIRRPQLDLGMGKGGRHLSEQRPQFFLKMACCSASASAWRGRGTCGLCLRRTR